ncbi:TonB-dependent siderophore receptor [Onishia taeanensis]
MTAKHPLTLAIALASATTFAPAWAQDAASSNETQTLDTLTITSAATKTDTSLNETPQTVSVVKREEWEEKGAETVQRALDYTPGAFTNQIGASNRYDYIVLRGFTDGSVNNTYLDGLKVMGDSGSFSSLTVDPWFLDSIEVVKGPASVLYGRASPGGLVAMQSKRPEFGDSGEIRLTAGNNAQRSAAFDFTGTMDDEKRIAYRLTGLASAEDTQVESVEEERYAFSPQITMDVTDNTTISLMGYFQEDPEGGYHSGLPYEGTVTDHNGITLDNNFYEGDEDYEKFQRSQRMVGYDFEHRFGNGLTARQKLRYLSSEVELDQVYAYGWGSVSENKLYRAYSGGEENLHAWTVDNQLEKRFSTGAIDHTLLIGADYQTRTNDVNWSRGVADTLGVSESSDTDISLFQTEVYTRELEQTGIYLQEQATFGRWNLAAGIRNDWVNINNTGEKDSDYTGYETIDTTVSESETSGRLGLIYGFDNGISPFISYSTSFTPNTATDGDYKMLDPATGKQIETGLKYQPNGTRDQYSITLFRTNQENVATKDPADDYYEAIGEIESQGVELEARAQLNENLSLQAGYSLTDVVYVETLEDHTEGNTANQVPRHQVSVWGNYAFHEGSLAGLDAGLGVRHYADIWADSENTEKVPDYTLVDATLGYDLSQLGFEGVTTRLNVTNLLDEEYIASCYDIDFCYYGAERSVTASLNYAF